ncbi:hypothetical protein B9Z55_001393 [Caenorhabditis nigoni]|uniref:Uncharacterized protein n=1 Tax=Caenorhabditis nigoni TaxID=1611254 RepID=A0A2G5VFJ8_9PELO|nr:hypothetical protein B9Z55_001393 [Caenorhabditis nigoni]
MENDVKRAMEWKIGGGVPCYGAVAVLAKPSGGREEEEDERERGRRVESNGEHELRDREIATARRPSFAPAGRSQSLSSVTLERMASASDKRQRRWGEKENEENSAFSDAPTVGVCSTQVSQIEEKENA